MARTLLFDLDETILDTAPLEDWFRHSIGGQEVHAVWQSRLLQMTLVDMVTGRYHDWRTLVQAALRSTGQQSGADISDAAMKQFEDIVVNLPARKDARTALDRLHEAGHPLALLTNLPRDAARTQLHAAGLTGFFEEIMSAEAVHRFKPAREPYVMAAEHLGVKPGALRLVSARPWDVTGAIRAGLHAAHVDHLSMRPVATDEAPDLHADSLGELAERLVEAEFGATFPG